MQLVLAHLPVVVLHATLLLLCFTILHATRPVLMAASLPLSQLVQLVPTLAQLVLLLQPIAHPVPLWLPSISTLTIQKQAHATQTALPAHMQLSIIVSPVVSTALIVLRVTTVSNVLHPICITTLVCLSVRPLLSSSTMLVSLVIPIVLHASHCQPPAPAV